ncbi:MAG: hypothetical protein KatS3mg105_2358 [Gemmatales bacterium]|nr:MAG: hypothetical protein KatS3mg105_2358 [Gemmatales bacterium]
MRKILIIALRDYLATVKTKAFLIGLVLIPLLTIGGGILVAGLTYLFMLYGDFEDKTFAVVDRTPGQKILPSFLEAARLRNEKRQRDKASGRYQPAFLLIAVEPSADTPEAVKEQRYALSERVLKGEFFGFLEIGPDVCLPHPGEDQDDWELLPKINSQPLGGSSPPVPIPKPKKSERAYIRYQSDRPTYQAFPAWAEKTLNRLILRCRWLEAGVPPEKMPSLRPVPFYNEGLSRRDAETGEIEEPPFLEQLAGYLIPVGVVFLMFLTIMLGTGPAMNNIIEEKMQRIAEVLLAAVRPFDLMLGKLFGITAVSLTISLIYLGGGYLMAYVYGVGDYISAALICWFLLYQILALMMYGSLSLAIGAAASDIKSTQPYLLPLALLATLPMLFLAPVLQNPNSTFSTGLSFFPFATPMLMIARMAVPPGIEWWQPVVGIVPVALTTLFCVWVAGRVFRVGILMQGKGANLADLVRWAVRG